MTHFSQQDNFSVAARVLGALFYYAPESAEAAPLVAVLTRDGWETQWPLPEASLAPLVTAFQTQSEETHAQAWQRLFVGPWALPSPPWGVGLAGSRICAVWRFNIGTSSVDARERHSV
ncbi:Tat proofreading chaperone DmsD [Escherichia coli]|nr:Tat proofreading chaperone DmsD [Escherichia coli]